METLANEYSKSEFHALASATLIYNIHASNSRRYALLVVSVHRSSINNAPERCIMVAALAFIRTEYSIQLALFDARPYAMRRCHAMCARMLHRIENERKK